MKEINFSNIVDVVERLCIRSNYILNDDIKNGLLNAISSELSPIGRDTIDKILLNATIAKDENVAMCQDTGLTVVFVEYGQDIKINGGLLEDAINQGVRQGYEKGYLRKSVVGDPIIRKNTGDNTPAVIHYNIVNGENLKITLSPKGFGSENMSALKMLKPSDGILGIINFVIETVDKAGPNPCPPIVVGVGIGGTMEKAALLSKKALMRNIDIRSELPHIKELENELLLKINKLGIGPSGLGGITTGLAVNIETYPTHIAGLPVAVNISCHATRHAEYTF